MRNSAPALVVELSPDRPLRLAALLLPAAALAAIGAWAWVQFSADHDGADHITAIALTCGALVIVTLLAARRAHAVACHPGLLQARANLPAWQATHLNWDGVGWALTRSDGAGREACLISVQIDANGWLLLHLRGQRGQPDGRREHWTCWLALAQHKLSADWHTLRCALYSKSLPPDRINDR
jgi:hypothetical protein